MAKDYFQDILPPDNGRRPVSINASSVKRDPDVRPATVVEEVEEVDDDIASADTQVPQPAPERSIRNIAAPQRRRDDLQDAPRYSPPLQRPRRRMGKKWIWIIAAIFVLAIATLVLIALRGTTVTVVPQSHTVVFDETSRFTAYPAATAATGTLSYTTQTIELEDSEVVTSSGTVQAQEKASGNVTVFNDFSTSPFRLVKNTRFESTDGLIFRAPSDIVVPGKQGSTPGQITVTIVADQPGEKYNIAASRLTIPGLKGAAEYTKVYAQASQAMTGGFSGERPGIADGELEGARALVRSRLENKARTAVSALATEGVSVFPELTTMIFVDLPTTLESGKSARIHQKAIVTAALLPADQFALSVARTVSADADNASVRLEPVADFGALLVNASSTLGTDPLQFGLTGTAILIWEIDTDALAQALAGRDQSAFPTIVKGFSGIQSATARIEPFWSSSFPSEASRIRVKIAEPATPQE